MGFLKNRAIKNTTIKRTRQLWDSIAKLMPGDVKPENFEKEVKEALLKYIKLSHIGGSGIKLPLNLNTASSADIFVPLVGLTVLDELSYDRTMGTKEDLDLIETVIGEETLKIFVRK